jgi:hypothetical protein
MPDSVLLWATVCANRVALMVKARTYLHILHVAILPNQLELLILIEINGPSRRTGLRLIAMAEGMGLKSNLLRTLRH